ncbi:Endonuclease/exonuclease/phosphatase [Cladochytrium replicatum]|nr:Endonuclease/exonuclease/phosphatase [Cladochytrium replicatum]
MDWEQSVTQKWSPFPPTFVSTPGEHVKDHSAFIASETKSLSLNSLIPPNSPMRLRLASYNIHFFRDRSGNDNISRVLNDVSLINPDIVVFQEVPYTYTPKTSNMYDARMRELGYIYHVRSCTNEHMELGNVLYSKLPLRDTVAAMMSGTRCFASAVVDLPDGSGAIRIVGTHLEVNSQEQRIEEMRAILEFLQSRKSLDKSVVGHVIMGDFNEHRDAGSFTVAADAGYADPFLLSMHVPQYTCWTGTVIDFILVETQLLQKVRGTFLFHTTASDHVPVIVDLA